MSYSNNSFIPELVNLGYTGQIIPVLLYLLNYCITNISYYSDGHSALLAAAIHGHCNAIRLLLDEGGHINLLSDDGFAPLSATFHRLYLLQNCPVLNVHQVGYIPISILY